MNLLGFKTTDELCLAVATQLIHWQDASVQKQIENKEKYDDTKGECELIGEVVFEDLEGVEQHIRIAMDIGGYLSSDMNDFGTDLGSVAITSRSEQNTEAGDMVILIDKNFYDSLFLNNQYVKAYVRGVIAHELGHFLAGHLAYKPDNTLIDLDTLHVKSENCTKTKFWYEVAKSVVNGGVFKEEYEADLLALNYCGTFDLITVHLELSMRSSSLIFKCEHYNRLARHRKDIDESTINRRKFSLKLYQ